ncbi:putative helicase mug81 [Tritrichomonas foetus]|uniref:Helicase mug81 n=1 Tax=Tritrichomonas foetus TaxID=1144522 RepID=A0A1J4JCU7_9EUKA|nr:putative helicase mug81 [Tritrichomonas foetus]|eukprot:OHS96505.1 putative helicase mug81 [Tritrichomonas foetus]
MNTAPWGNSSIDSWLEDLISTCVDSETAHHLQPNIKKLLFSSQTNDSLQYPLFELLGDTSFDVIETLLNNRARMQEDSISEKFHEDMNSSEATPPPPPPTIKRTVPMARSSRFNHTETVNSSRYDVEAPKITRPQVKHIPITNLPKWARPCFPSCDSFNDIQSLVYEEAYNTNENMLVCAPTGAGKTNVALLAILQEIRKHIVEKPGLPSLVNHKDNFLIVYITPMKALATEIKEKFTTSLRHLKVNVKEYTGDTKIPAAELERSHLLVATPEKWDIATRRGGEDAIGARLKLLIIDEIHLLQDDRGPVLEALVARTLRQVEQQQSMIRIVGLSATLPNCQDVANFLRVPDPGLFIFGPEYRPVPLAMTLIGAKNTVNVPRGYKEVFDEIYTPNKDKDIIQIDVVAVELVQKIIDDGYQVLIFVHTRGETSRFANILTKYIELPISNDFYNIVNKKNMQPSLRECLIKGVGIHHAGLPRSDRLFVENSFRSNSFPVLVCTATLAWGVNLPAHTVIIKDTKVYNQEHGGYEDIGILDVHQMFGRAGRPQFDTSGHAILITTTRVLPKYTTTLVNAEPIESQFTMKVEDFLNAEISLGTVTCRQDALKWIRYTFMYQLRPDDNALVTRLDIAANELSNNLMIRTSIASESLQPTHLGQVASMHYIPFKAVRHFNDTLKGEMTEAELLDCIFSSGMFQSLIVRSAEIHELENFDYAIPLLTPYDEIPGKVNILFQAFVSRYNFRTPSLALDQSWIADNMQRVFDAIFELAIERGWCFIAIFALNLCKMVEHQMWWAPEKKDHPLRQVLKQPKYNPLFKKLDRLGLTVEDIKNTEYNKLKSILRNDQFALEVLHAAKRFPSINIGVRYQPMSDTIVSIIISVIFPFDWDRSIVHETEMFWVFIQEYDGSAMYHAQEITIDRRIAKEGLEMQVLVPLSASNTYLISMSSVRFLGVEDSQELVVKDADHTTFTPFVTEVPNLKLLNVKDVITNPNIQKLFPYNTFNAIQTQLFHQAYHTNDSLLICAPNSCGKTVIAELAIARMLESKDTLAKAVYIVPLKSIIYERVLDWRKKFGYQLAELSGEQAPDSKAIARSRIIITTPERWDSVSRGHTIRQFLKYVSLLILDEVHLLGTERGHVIEAVTDRMKSTGCSDIRIIGLSNCLSNPLDVAQFLGIPYRGVYNFPLKMRTVRLITWVRGFPGRHYGPRMAAMNKPLSDAIIERAHGKPTLVFVSSRRQTRLTAQDLISFASSAGKQFYYCTPQATAAASQVKDKDLSKFLHFGVGLHHGGLIPQDLAIIEKLFAEGNLNLLVATSTLAWGVKLPAHFIVIKGTEYFDSKTGQYAPYTVTEMQQMIGRAGRPGVDNEGLVMILCEESRRDFLKDFINSPFPIESSMPQHICDHVNAEVSCGRIRSRKSLLDWLEHTYFAVRLNLNPRYYGNGTLAQIAEDTVKELTYSKCIKYNNHDYENSYIPTAAGRIGSIFYVSYQTVRLFIDKMNDTQNIVDVLDLICQAKEFKEIPFRHNEDDIMNQMTPKHKKADHQNQQHSPSATKTFYLLQYYLSHRKMPVTDFEADLANILETIPRVVGCFVELCAAHGNLHAMLNGILVLQMLIQGMWWDEVPLKALLKEASLKDLKNRLDIRTLPQLLLMENMPNGFKPICNRILLYSTSSRTLNNDRKQFAVELNKINGEIGSTVVSPHYTNRDKQSLYIVIGNPETGEVFCHRRVKLEEEKINVVLESKKQINDECWIYLISDSYLGIDQMYSISGTVVTTQLYLRPKKLIHVEKKRRTSNLSSISSSSQISTSSNLPNNNSFDSSSTTSTTTTENESNKRNRNNRSKNRKTQKQDKQNGSQNQQRKNSNRNRNTPKQTTDSESKSTPPQQQQTSQQQANQKQTNQQQQTPNVEQRKSNGPLIEKPNKEKKASILISRSSSQNNDPPAPPPLKESQEMNQKERQKPRQPKIQRPKHQREEKQQQQKEHEKSQDQQPSHKQQQNKKSQRKNDKFHFSPNNE